MAKRDKSQPPVRKSLLVAGGVLLAIAMAAFLFTNVIGSGGGGPTPPGDGTRASPAPSPAPFKEAALPVLRPGGRDPFHALISSGSGANPQAQATPAPVENDAVLVELVSVDGPLANVRVGSTLHEKISAGAKLSEGFVLEALQQDCAFIADGPERFRLCEGERFLK